jgi:Dynamin family
MSHEARPGVATAAKATVRPDLLSRLQALSFLATEAGSLKAASDASLLAARTEQGLFYVACIGQFKRGKSTLLNAILGEPVLPAGVVPITSVVTVVRHGTRRGARIRLSSGQWQEIALQDLVSFVSEAENPENIKGVLGAEAFLPHPLLASGLCLVDTPGLGSVFEANSVATRQFVPHIDAALVVLGADPPLSGDELRLVEEVSKTVKDFLFVLSKADRLTERDRQEALRFAERVLAQRLERPIGPILEVSATECLASGTRTRDLPKLHESLARLAQEAGADLVFDAQVRGLRRISARVLQELEEQREALRRPVAESERRIEILRRSVTGAERAAQDLGYLFSAEQDKLSAAFEERRKEFVARAMPEARYELDKAISSLAREGTKSLRKEAPVKAREIARLTLEAWLPEVEPAAETMYSRATDRFVELTNEFFGRLADSDDTYALNPPRPVESEAGFRTRRRFYFSELFELAPGETLGWMSDLARDKEHAVAAAQHDAGEYLHKLLEHNSTRVVNDLDERVLESRRQLESEIRERLHEVCDSATRALERARSRQAAGEEAVRAELIRLDDVRRRVESLAPESDVG